MLQLSPIPGNLTFLSLLLSYHHHLALMCIRFQTLSFENFNKTPYHHSQILFFRSYIWTLKGEEDTIHPITIKSKNTLFLVPFDLTQGKLSTYMLLIQFNSLPHISYILSTSYSVSLFTLTAAFLFLSLSTLNSTSVLPIGSPPR